MNDDDHERRQWFRREVLPLADLLRANAARFSGGDTNDIDDLVHETYANLISFPGWRGIDDVPAFALVTLRNLARQAVRRRKVVPIEMVADLDQFDYPDQRPTAERTLEAREDLRLLVKVIAEMPPQCRRVFTLCKVYGLSHQEIAVRLGLSIFTVEKHVSKGLRICIERLAVVPRRRRRSLVSSKRARPCGESA